MKTIIAIALLYAQLSALAQLVVDFEGGDPLSVGPGTAGFSFTVGATPLTLQTLGLWQETPLNSSHLVGIWEMTTPQHTLLASALVTPQTATGIGEFWYVNLGAPLTLLAGREYMIGARYADNDFDFAMGNVASVTTDPRIALGDAWLSSGIGFEFPELNVSGANLGFFGPNAGFAPVPEPAGVLLASALALGVFAFLRRRMA